MRTPSELSGVLDRGGRPTVRDLLSSLNFNPVDGTIRLNGDRVVTQRAAVGTELRRELTRVLGPQEARIFLIRLGFLSGQSDARFVRTSWPHLDPGDAFTAGTRLHTFSGVVRVETAYNDFDLRKKRFAGEFRWHDSVEAAEFHRGSRSTQPVCWTQLGYASGYASEFFGLLIVYKEIECAAQGHAHCRVIGKPADVWGAMDPDVMLFRERIAGTQGPPCAPSRSCAPQMLDSELSELDRLMLAPVRSDLARLSNTALPVLVSGAQGTGRRRLALHLHRISGASERHLRQVFGTQVDTQMCEDIAGRGKVRDRAAAGSTIVIHAAEAIPSAVQPLLAHAIGDVIPKGGPRVIALLGPDRFPGAPGLSQELWYTLSALSVRMPAFAERDGERADIARATLCMLAKAMGRQVPRLDKTAVTVIEQAAWPGNLSQMRSVLAAVLAAHPDDRGIQGRQVETELRRLSYNSVASGGGGRDLISLINRQMGEGTFSVSALEQLAYEAAMTRTRGNLSASARLLGLTRAQLAYRLGSGTAREAPGGNEA